jgi:replicative DNA helicase
MTAQRKTIESADYRQPPLNLDAERALLGAILINNAAHDRVVGFLGPEHFYDEMHAKIFETAAKLIASGKLADPFTLKPFFANLEPIDVNTTVPQYLGHLAARATTIVNAREYGRTIRDLATRRQLILIAEDVSNAAYDSPVDFPPAEQIEEIEARLYSLAEADKYGQGFASFEATSAAAMEMAASARKRGGVSGVATHFIDIDAKTGGLQNSDLIVLAGRPSIGKTSLGTNIAFNVARARHRSKDGKDGAVVGFFSLEMSGEQLSTRILAEQAGIASQRMRRGVLTDAEFARLGDVHRDLATIPLHIDQTGDRLDPHSDGRHCPGNRDVGAPIGGIHCLLYAGMKLRMRLSSACFALRVLFGI